MARKAFPVARRARRSPLPLAVPIPGRAPYWPLAIVVVVVVVVDVVVVVAAVADLIPVVAAIGSSLRVSRHDNRGHQRLAPSKNRLELLDRRNQSLLDLVV
jgi:hypothetical protein